MSQRVLSAVVVRIIVSVDRLRLQPSNRVKLFDGCSAQPGQRPKDCSLDLCHLCVLHCIHQRVLSLRRVVLQFLCCVLLAKRGNLVEIHLEVMGHLLGQIILWGSTCKSTKCPQTFGWTED